MLVTRHRVHRAIVFHRAIAFPSRHRVLRTVVADQTPFLTQSRRGAEAFGDSNSLRLRVAVIASSRHRAHHAIVFLRAIAFFVPSHSSCHRVHRAVAFIVPSRSSCHHISSRHRVHRAIAFIAPSRFLAPSRFRRAIASPSHHRISIASSHVFASSCLRGASWCVFVVRRSVLIDDLGDVEHVVKARDERDGR
jgi:hypothetical protein